MSARPEIVHVIHSGGFYGAERMLADHCLAMAHRFDMSVAFIDPPSELIERFKSLGIQCDSVGSARELVQLIGQRKVVLNAHNFRAQVFAWLAARKAARPLVFTQHGFTPRSLKQKIYMWISLLLCKTAPVTRVVCVAQSLVRLHRSFRVKEAKLALITNGLPEPVAFSEVMSANAEESTGQIGFIGRLSHEKGPDFFLQAVIPLLHQDATLQAVFIGDGPMRTELETEAKARGLASRIRFAGYQDQVSSWLQRLSVLVLSSRTEGTPMVLLEAMQAGVAVAAFAVGGIPDVVTHGEHALLAEPENVPALQEQIRLLLQEPDKAKELQHRARERQREHYSLVGACEKWKEVYDRSSMRGQS